MSRWNDSDDAKIRRESLFPQFPYAYDRGYFRKLWIAGAGLGLLAFGVPKENTSCIGIAIILLVVDLCVVPRELYVESTIGLWQQYSRPLKIFILGGLSFVTVVMSYLVMPTLLRDFILTRGISIQAVVEKKLDDPEIFEIVFTAATGEQIRAKTYPIPLEIYHKISSGTAIPLHYLKQNPRWLVLDEITDADAEESTFVTLFFFLMGSWIVFRMNVGRSKD